MDGGSWRGGVMGGGGVACEPPSVTEGVQCSGLWRPPVTSRDRYVDVVRPSPLPGGGGAGGLEAVGRREGRRLSKSYRCPGR